MARSSNPTEQKPARFGGWLDGVTGVLIFSASLPATRLAVQGFDPVFVTLARAAIAGVLAAALLGLTRAPWPRRQDLVPLVIVAAGAVAGFPLLTALALRHVTSTHATVFLGLLPLSTAIFAVLRAGERPPPAFWGFAAAGAALIGAYVLALGGSDPLGDLQMIAAVAVCGLGYAEGGRLSRHMGGLRVIAWALVLCLPLSAPLALHLAPHGLAGVGWPAIAGLGYVSIFSMLVGFVFWYRGLAHGGVAAVGQLQLVQPFLALILASTLLGETVSPAVLGCLVGVLACVAGARRFAASPQSPAVQPRQFHLHILNSTRSSPKIQTEEVPP